MTTDRGDAAAKALRRATGGGAPRRRSAKRPTASSTSRDPQPVGDAVGELIAQRGWTQDRAAAQVTSQWPQIVGEDLAVHVVPTSFSEGVLVLQADSTSWATQVRHLLPELRRSIDGAVGTGVVTDIRILAPAAPSWTAGPRVVRGRGPRDTYG